MEASGTELLFLKTKTSEKVVFRIWYAVPCNEGSWLRLKWMPRWLSTGLEETGASRGLLRVRHSHVNNLCSSSFDFAFCLSQFDFFYLQPKLS